MLPGMLALLVASSGVPAAHAGGAQAEAAGAAAGEAVSVDLPVSLDRIWQILDRRPALEEGQGMLRLNIQVRVFAPAPPIVLYEGIDLEHSAPRYGFPVHAEMVAATTPSRLAFRRGTPAFTTGNALSWGGR